MYLHVLMYLCVYFFHVFIYIYIYILYYISSLKISNELKETNEEFLQTKNIKVKTYRSIILVLFIMGVKIGLSH